MPPNPLAASHKLEVPDDFDTHAVAMGGDVYFLGCIDPTGCDLWVVREGEVSPELVADTHGADSVMAAANGLVYFVDENSDTWVSDGTEAGTTLLADWPISVLSADSVGGVTVLETPNGAYRTDGTPQGTVPLWASDEPFPGGAVHVWLEEDTVWSSNGEDPPVALLTEPVTGLDGAWLDNQFIFSWVSESTDDSGLWATDGTPEGTRILRPSRGGGQFVQAGEFLYYRGDSSIWVTDGTGDGTRKVRFPDGKNVKLDSGSRLTNVDGVLWGATDVGWYLQWFTVEKGSRTAEHSTSYSMGSEVAVGTRIFNRYEEWDGIEFGYVDKLYIFDTTRPSRRQESDLDNVSVTPKRLRKGQEVTVRAIVVGRVHPKGSRVIVKVDGEVVARARLRYNDDIRVTLETANLRRTRHTLELRYKGDSRLQPSPVVRRFFRVI